MQQQIELLADLIDEKRIELTEAKADEAEQSDAAQEAISAEMTLAMFKYMPLRSMLSFTGDKADPGLIEQILKTLNS